MANYKLLLSHMFELKNELENKVKFNSSKLNCYKKVKDVVNYSTLKREYGAKLEKMIKLKKYLPQLSTEFRMLENMNHYSWSIYNDMFNFKADDLIRDLEFSHSNYDFPTKEQIEKAKKFINVLDEVRNTSYNKLKVLTVVKTVEELAREKAIDIAQLILIIDNVEISFANIIIREIRKEFENIDPAKLEKENEEIKGKLMLILKYSNMFSSSELLVKFERQEEIEEFKTFIQSFLSEDEVDEVINNVYTDQNKEDVKEEKITFDNLDLTKFNDTERNIINNMHEILVNEDLEDGEQLTNNDTSLSEYFSIYQNKPLVLVLQDVKNNLIERIYHNKDDVIRIIKFVIELYNNYILRIAREEKVKELLRIRDDFNNISSFINRNYLDKAKAFEESSKIGDFVSDIETNYIPTLEDIITSNMPYDEYFDQSFDRIIQEYKEKVNSYKEIMSSCNKKDEEYEEDKENTNNLVFCINSDINLTTEGHLKEFTGAVIELESKTSNELKSQVGRKSLYKLRKPNEYNKEENFVDYLQKRFNMKINFVPYRFSSGRNFRTGVIKFTASQVVKKYLERHYNLSKQCAIYGVFEVIQVVRADHSEYSYLHDYVVNNCLEIERVAKLFASPNPNTLKLTEIIDNYLMIKKDKTNEIKGRPNK